MQQRITSGTGLASQFLPFKPHASSKRRQLTILAGEARSANRTKWTRRDAEQLLEQQVVPISGHVTDGANEQLADISDPHELVGHICSPQIRART